MTSRHNPNQPFDEERVQTIMRARSAWVAALASGDKGQATETGEAYIAARDAGTAADVHEARRRQGDIFQSLFSSEEAGR